MNAESRSSNRASTTDPSSSRRRGPVELAVVIAFFVFLVEIIEPVLFRLLPPMSKNAEVFLDGLVMVAVLVPLMYFGFVQRMIVQIQMLSQADDKLRNVNARLESVVDERTNELLTTNRQLSRLIDEQRSTADSLRRTNRFVENVFQQAPCLILTFDANSRQCAYVNSRITDLLGYAEDEIAVTTVDFIDRLVWSGDRIRFLAVLKTLSYRPEGAVERGTCGFASAAGERVELTFGVTVLDWTPERQAKHLLLTAMPATV